MPGPKPNKLHDDLDALLDGRPFELTDELVPLVEAADALRAELAPYELDPEVADRHLARVLDDSAPVVALPARGYVNGWRRRMAAAVLAAVLVLAPATMASAAALPGQAMYPLKLAIEQLRLASVQWSPAREAGERIRIADERLEELDQIVELGMDTQVPVAVRAVDRAVMAATRAVQEAEMEGADITKAAGELQAVKQEQQAQLATLFQRLPTTPASIRKEIATAVQQSKAPSQQVTPRRNTTTPPTSTAAPGPVPAGSPSTTTLGAATTTQPTTTTEPTTTTTTEPTTTSEPPTTVAPENTTGSLEQQGQDEQAPPSSAGP
ncbi:MAG: hypothetical protein K0S88_2875 [Actinomycetia bacterium]|nr:hypothetical protein [Actinomycetes bacterium]